MPIDMNALARAGASARLTELQQEIADLRAAFPDLEKTTNPLRPGRPRRQAAQTSGRTRKPMSAAAKRAVGERMKAYWAKRKGTAPATEAADTEPAEAKPKRTLSPEARARIAAAQKRRWAKARKKR